MINCDYKMGELLTLIIMIKRDYKRKYDQDVEEANKAFRDAEEKNAEHLSYLYCKYAFLTLWDETKEEAENVKSLIKRKKNIK